MKLGNYLDFVKNEIRNATIQNLSAAPSSPNPGQIYYDTTLGSAYQYNGTAWVPFDASKATNIPTTAIINFATTILAYTLNQFAAPTASVPFNAQRITGLADPTGTQDGATKNYVDTNIQASAAGISSKPSVYAAATSNVTALTGLPTVDGVTLSSGQRLLLTAQTTASQNGPWLVSSGSWARPGGDASPNNELTVGALWYVEAGSVNAGLQFILATPTSGTITPGTTNVTINKFGSSAVLTASTGVQLVGSVIEAQVVAGGGVLAGGSGLSVDTTVVARKYATSIGDGTSTSYTVTHGLATTDVIVEFHDSSGNLVFTDYQAATTNTITVTFATAPASNAIRVIVHG